MVKKDEIVVTYFVHSGDPKNCHRCDVNNTQGKIMTDEEFCKLQRELEEVYLKMVYLQYKYRKETGRDFVFGQGFIHAQKNTTKGSQKC